MATPTQPPIQANTIKSAARKLPIKRKTPPQHHHEPQPDPAPINIIPIPNPNPNPIDPLPAPPAAAAYADEDYDDDEFDDESQEEETNNSSGGGGGEITLSSSGGGGDNLKPPPFKFHRIWSESDEIRFLQGLLGCWSQGMIFPRDLNLFYDRFSESMPQPYSRSQLSEKLRRLRKKFRIVSARIARGQDPNRLAPHDRDLLHLCTRLWDPKYSSTSPFSAPDPASSGSTGNKRRRPNPRAPAALLQTPKTEDVPPPPPALLAPVDERNDLELGAEKVENGMVVFTEEMPVPVAVPVPAETSAAAPDRKMEGEDIRDVTAKSVLDVLESSLQELRASLQGEASGGSDMSRRWQEQRIAELDVFARRLRLVLERSLQN